MIQKMLKKKMVVIVINIDSVLIDRTIEIICFASISDSSVYKKVLTGADGLPVNTDRGDNLLSFGGIVISTTKKTPFLTQLKDLEEESNMDILYSDNMLVICRITENDSCVEFYIYNRNSKSFYVHHDIMLCTYPLCIEWINFDPADGSNGNMVAIGSMDPDITIWDVDIVNVIEPAFILSGTKRKKEKKSKLLGHSKAVIDLSWNSQQKHVLASASADCIVGLWDLTQGTMCTAIEDHTDIVQSVEWHPFEPALVLTGSVDKTVRTFDCRRMKYTAKKWNVPASVEKVIWNREKPFTFFAGLESGEIFCYDVRHTDPLFHFEAHKKEISGLATSCDLPGCLFSSSFDEKLRIWDVRDMKKPSLMTEEKPNVSEIISMAACPDERLTVAVGGPASVRVLNLDKDKMLKEKFGFKYQSRPTTILQPENEGEHVSDEEGHLEQDDDEDGGEEEEEESDGEEGGESDGEEEESDDGEQEEESDGEEEEESDDGEQEVEDSDGDE